MEKYDIVRDYSKNVRRFNLRGRTLEFQIKPIPEGADPMIWLKDAINQVVLLATEGLQPNDQVGFTFCSKNFERGQGWVRFRPAEEVTVDDVWGVLNSIYQSNSSGLDTDTFCLGVTSVRMPVGRGRGRNYNTFTEECASRNGIVVINNKDNLCLPRALVVAMAYVDKDANYMKIRQDKRHVQTDRVIKLLEDTLMDIPEAGAGIFEIQQFQDYLRKEYKIVVYRYGTKGRDVFFEGPDADKTLNLLYHEGHYNVITSLTAAFCCIYYCEACHIPYSNKNRHRCGGTCQACQQSPACTSEVKIKCTECFRTFRNNGCYENHKNPKSYDHKNSVCSMLHLCSVCLKMIKSDRKHTCGEIYCKICQKHKPENHLCFIPVDTGKPKTKDILFIFYDLETRQEKLLDDGSLQHEVNLCVFKQCCDTCITTDTKDCQKCGVRLQKIKGKDAVVTLLHHVLQQRKKFKVVTVIAHNGQAFDHQFILNYILQDTDLTPELIMRGTKIILMQIGNVTFIDSLNYFPMSLSKFSVAFGLGDKFKKGYFPHLFNTNSNENYIGLLPAVKYYSPDTMKNEDRAEFMQWYHEHKNDEFNMQREMVDYCVSDVEILTEACVKFRTQMISTTGVCPFTEASTIASTCSKVYRRNFLKPNTIGVIPRKGYRYRDNQSKIALQWLIWEERQRSINILHAAKGKEIVLNGVKLDGYCESTNQIFEFHGCYWHGCPNCYKYNRDRYLHKNSTDSLNFRYESTVAKIERLKGLRHDVIEMWECQFRKSVGGNNELKNYTENHPLLMCTPLNPRDAFFGGRTGNCKTYYKVKETEKIKYLDVCSLYPWVCKNGKFPVGHPQVYVGKECQKLDLLKTDGLIKCKILPPSELYHPVLPVKMNGKLMFVLCRTCGQNMDYNECKHTDEQKALMGTWVIDEVLKALEKGYKILDIHEIWKYKIEQFNPQQNNGGLFVQMMNKFIRIKQTASGFPVNCITQQQKDQYIEEFLNNEGIKLNFSEIVKNPGLRSLAKLILNSFWGKFGQRECQPKTKIVNKPEDFLEMLINPSIDINSVLPINNENLLVNYQFIEEDYEQLSTINVCIASYTTAQARLKLYSYLEILEDRVLYYDTDSVIFSQKEGQQEISTGECIGDLTDELVAYGSGSYISEFVSGGPKNYAYRLYSTAENKEKVVCKVKGICLNYNTSKTINFESIRDMILKNDSEPISIVSKNIRRTAIHQVVTKTEIKKYKPNSLKRKFLPNFDSVPYGFKMARLK